MLDEKQSLKTMDTDALRFKKQALASQLGDGERDGAESKTQRAWQRGSSGLWEAAWKKTHPRDGFPAFASPCLF